jgi:sterol desaturase/sphingolipid hydroxylase (fatty acid hydroxylase superfamily)
LLEPDSPVGAAAEYAHPLEQLLGNYVPVLAAPVLMRVHTSVWLAWFAWRLIATYERHSGVDLSGTWLGRLGLFHGHGARLHDLHHSSNNGNYGSGMDLFDVLAGSRVYGLADRMAAEEDRMRRKIASN